MVIKPEDLLKKERAGSIAELAKLLVEKRHSNVIFAMEVAEIIIDAGYTLKSENEERSRKR